MTHETKKILDCLTRLRPTTSSRATTRRTKTPRRRLCARSGPGRDAGRRNGVNGMNGSGFIPNGQPRGESRVSEPRRRRTRVRLWGVPAAEPLLGAGADADRSRATALRRRLDAGRRGEPRRVRRPHGGSDGPRSSGGHGDGRSVRRRPIVGYGSPRTTRFSPPKRRAASRRRRGVQPTPPISPANRAGLAAPVRGRGALRGGGRPAEPAGAAREEPGLEAARLGGVHVTRRFFSLSFFFFLTVGKVMLSTVATYIAFFIAIARVWSSRRGEARAGERLTHPPSRRRFRHPPFPPPSPRGGACPSPASPEGVPPPPRAPPSPRAPPLARLAGLGLPSSGFAVGVGFGRVALGRLGRRRRRVVARGKVGSCPHPGTCPAPCFCPGTAARPASSACAAAGGVVVRVRAGDGFARITSRRHPAEAPDALRRVGGAPERLGGGAESADFGLLQHLDHPPSSLALPAATRVGVRAVCSHACGGGRPRRCYVEEGRPRCDSLRECPPRRRESTGQKSNHRG